MAVAEAWPYSALTGDAAVIVGNCVIQVTASGGPAAAGARTGCAAGPEQALQAGAGPVAGFLVAVITVGGGDRLGGHLHRPPAAGTGGDGAAGGAGSQRLASRIGDDDLPAGGAVPGQGAGQLAGGAGV